MAATTLKRFYFIFIYLFICFFGGDVRLPTMYGCVLLLVVLLVSTSSLEGRSLSMSM
jgi:hypothetical protein